MAVQQPLTQDRAASIQFSPQDVALRSAYEAMLRYDRASGDQKSLYVRLRQIVIWIGFATTLIAVMAATLSPEFRAQIDQALASGLGALGIVPSNVGAGVLRGLLVILPALSSGILAYSSEFVPGNLWFDYRVLAERLRREIYKYRTTSTEYLNKSTIEQQQHLLEVIRQVDLESGAPVSVHQRIVQDMPDFEGMVKKAMYEEQPFSRLTVDQYIQQRLLPQRSWYLKRCYDDHHSLKRTRRISLAVAALGSILALIAWEPWVAVTTAGALALGMITDLRMYGRTYNIYHQAAQQLRSEYDLWSIQDPQMRADLSRQADLVERVEKIFADEIENWTRQAKQSSAELEEALSRSVDEQKAIFDKDSGEIRVSVTAPSSANTGRVIEAAAATAAAASAGSYDESAAQIEVNVTPIGEGVTDGTTADGTETVGEDATEAATTKGLNDGAPGSREMQEAQG